MTNASVLTTAVYLLTQLLSIRKQQCKCSQLGQWENRMINKTSENRFSKFIYTVQSYKTEHSGTLLQIQDKT